MKIVVVSGGFDPIHSGHIELFKKASSLGDMLIVGVNSDEWLRRKKGKEFMPLKERKRIIESIKWVDSVWEFDDSDNSACELLRRVKDYYWTMGNSEIIFANGTEDGFAYALDANTGEELWKFQMGASGSSPPIIFVHKEKQYVSFLSTGGMYHDYKNKDSTIYTFSIEKR